MKKILVVLLALAMLLSLPACKKRNKGTAKEQPVKEQTKEDPVTSQTGNAPTELVMSEEEKRIYQIISSAGVESVTYEVKNKTNNSASIAAKVPNYTELMKAAFQTANPEKAFADAISNQSYTTVEYTGAAAVTVDNAGNEVIAVEDTLKKFIEQELIKAINALTEAEKGGSQA